MLVAWLRACTKRGGKEGSSTPNEAAVANKLLKEQIHPHGLL